MYRDNEKLYKAAREYFAAGKYSLCLRDLLYLSRDGDARATFCVAAIYDRGGDGITKDWDRARSLYKKSLEQRFTPAAALSLARMLYLGRGGDKDYVGAMGYYKLFPNDPFSLIMLGVMNLNGHGCPIDEGAALRLFDRAWKLGHPLGLKNSSILSFRHGQYMCAIFDFIKSALLIAWTYGFKKKPIVKGM